MDADEVMNSGAGGAGGTAGTEEDIFGADDELNEIDEGQGTQQQTEDETGQQAPPSSLSAYSKLKRLFDYHPECVLDYVETVVPRLQIREAQTAQTQAESKNDVEFATDENHKTYPFLTVYERTSIIGLRSEMLSNGAQSYIIVPDYITDVKEIARMELEQKRLPFIVKRPLPNGQYEYWRLADLMLI
jgi:DNA-directed RNA polymerase I, II, and III subunit RPABC2